MDGRVVAVTGATGRQGGAVARHLLASGWRVRALTRDAASTRARRLATAGAEVVAADMADRASLLAAFRGAWGVFSVQNLMISGLEDEVVQGRNVADAAADAGVEHVVYGSAGTGEPGTGIGAWDSKLQIEAHLRRRGLRVTVLRPTAFMELMVDRDFFPPVSTWGVMPRLVGWDRPLPWLCVDDLGAIAALVFAAPERFAGADLDLAADLRSLGGCRDAWRQVIGRAPRGIPLPPRLFARLADPDLVTMWRWLGTHDVGVDPAATRALLPSAATVPEWLAARTPGSRSAIRTAASRRRRGR